MRGMNENQLLVGDLLLLWMPAWWLFSFSVLLLRYNKCCGSFSLVYFVSLFSCRSPPWKTYLHVMLMYPCICMYMYVYGWVVCPDFLSQFSDNGLTQLLFNQWCDRNGYALLASKFRICFAYIAGKKKIMHP